MVDTAGPRASSTFFRVDWYFDCIAINAQSAASHKYMVQNGISMFRANPDTLRDSVLIASKKFINNGGGTSTTLMRILIIK